MMKKRSLVLVAIPVILGVLVYLQFRTWRRFDWGAFASVSSDLLHGRGLRHILIAVLLIYFTYWLRAVRWKLFLKPVRRARLRSLVPTQYIGFTSLALLGRPGELIRPYLIARKENLTVSSQMAVWTVERIFDIGAFAVLVCIDVFFFGHRLPHMQALQKLGGGLLALVAVMGLTALFVRRNGPLVADWLERRGSHLSPRLADSVGSKIRAFGEGLNTIHGGSAFLQLAGVSLAIWFVIAVAYRFVLHAYPQPVLHHMHVPQVLLLMASSMVGSMIQLPAVGGGSQLAVISMLSSKEWFAVPHELAVSAGMLLWLVTFMAVIPVGLALAHQEHLSLRKLSEETHEQAEAPARPTDDELKVKK
jgi:uncharacterized protein (TIRG00374 family)